MSGPTSVQNFQKAVQLFGADQLSESESLCRQILAQNPAHADAWHLLGVISHLKRLPQEAIDLIGRAIALHPDNAEYHNNLGEVFRTQQRYHEAISAYRRAIELAPGSPATRNNLGVVLRHQRDLKQAEEMLRSAIQLQPDYATAIFNLGNVLNDLGRTKDAVEMYREAIRLQPQFLGAHLNLGKVLLAVGDVEGAQTSLETALRLDSNHSEVLNQLGNLSKEQGRLDDAIAHYRRALTIQPHHAVAHSNLVHALLFHPHYNGAQILAEHRQWNSRHAARLPRIVARHTNQRASDRPLRIGYVSPNFCNHVVGWNLLPLFRQHDRASFRIICYSDAVQPDIVTANLRKCADEWHECAGWSDEQLALRVVHDEVDILVDLTLHMARHRLLAFARRPAPVQITFAGYPGTTGLDAIQYRLTDSFLDPVGADAPYSEASIRLPSFWCYFPRGYEPPIQEPPVISQGVVTFGCLNSFFKVSPEVISVWAKVLCLVPHSRLLLAAPPGDASTRTLRQLEQAGITSDRVAFIGKLPHGEYVATYQRMDVALDTFPYNGHTTSCDALWMGVPVVTLAGATVVGRAGASQLSNVGLSDLIANSPAEFVAKAVALARNVPYLQELRATLRLKMAQSPLMDASGFTRAIEAAYRDVWQKWCAE